MPQVKCADSSGDKAAYSQDDEWIRKNLESLVEQYPGRFVAVSNQQPYFSVSREQAEKEALSEHPKVRPSVFRIPRPQDFVCAL